MLATGIPPFNHAHLKDHRFVKLQENPDSFWEDYTNWNENVNLSLEFKDLVQKMLALRPVDRLTIQEILDHPWFKAHTATQEEVINEFLRRKDLASQRQTEQIEMQKLELK